MPFTPKYKCIASLNKNILLCNNKNLTVVKFRKLSINVIILSVVPEMSFVAVIPTSPINDLVLHISSSSAFHGTFRTA